MNVTEFLASDETSAFLDNISTIASITGSLSLFIAALLGLSFFAELREKRNEAVFSYLARLRTLLNFMLIILEKDHVGVLGYLKIGTNPAPQEVRRDAELRKSLVEYAKQIIQLLSETESQYPPEGESWSHYLNSLYKLLFVCQYMDTIQESYWTSSEGNQIREAEYTGWVDNTRAMLSMIEKKQTLVEKQMSPVMNRIFKWIYNTIVFRLCRVFFIKLLRYIADTRLGKRVLAIWRTFAEWLKKTLDYK